MKRDLMALALRYRCDKAIRHSYLRFYEDLLSELPVRNLLEIGIGYPGLMDPFVKGYITGASIYMWRDYLPEASIWSCDIQEDVLINEGRIRSFPCDQGDPDSLERLMDSIGRPLDLVIDDGSHLREHQVLTAKVLWPYVTGAYVIEDVLDVKGVAEELDGYGLAFGRQMDDNLVVLRR